MKSRSVLMALALVATLIACDPVPVQYPPGTYPYPSNTSSKPPANTSNPGLFNNPSQAQIDKERRWANAADTANKAAFLGGILGGPFGGVASMGMGALGFLYGWTTADEQLEKENALAQAQYQTEAKKDQQLEAAIEQELERQRALEGQVANVLTTKTQPASPQLAPIGQTQPPVSQPKGNPSLTALNKPVAPLPPSSPFKNVDVRDTSGDGVPDIWIYYDPQKPGEIIRQEEATKGDGRVDTWSYFKDGKLIRRDVDTKQQGRPDTVYYYDGDKLAREEHDETGQGRITYRAIYEGGRLAKVEKDLNGQGRPDLWVYYDTAKEIETVIKEERDLNGDGLVDLWTYYENGRLVRRDVSAVGLELLSKSEQIPVSTAELR